METSPPNPTVVRRLLSHNPPYDKHLHDTQMETNRSAMYEATKYLL